MKYAYIRVSTKDQNIDRQVEAMKEAGIDKSKMFMISSQVRILNVRIIRRC